MSTASKVDVRPPLVRLFQTWSGLLARHAAGQQPALLRLERGASLVREERLARLACLVGPLLDAAAPRLRRRDVLATGAGVRPKLRLSLGVGSSGLLAEVRYFGDGPSDEELRAGFAGAGAGLCPLPPLVGPLPAARPGEAAGLQLAPGEVCLRAVFMTAPRRLPVVRVMAGPRQVALPMFSLARGLTEDTMEREPARTHSLAHSLGEEPTPSSAGRPARLVLRGHGPAAALRVEALLGHGVERILPAGPLLGAVPWLLGVLEEECGAPTLVLDPLALPGLRAAAGDD